MPFTLKLTTFIFVFYFALLPIAIAAEDNGLSNDTSDNAEQLLVASIYESLYSAIEMDSANEVKQFIAFGADINYRYAGAKTPLMLASSMGSIAAVRTLIELGADPDLMSDENMTAMDYAKDSNDNYIIAVLQVKPSTQNALPQDVLPQDIDPVLDTDAEKQLVAKIQFYLTKLGYDAGLVDGFLGEKTQKSLGQFSIDYKQDYVAEISERQVDSLFDALSQPSLVKSIDPIDENPVEIELIEPIPTEVESDTLPDANLATTEPEILSEVR